MSITSILLELATIEVTSKEHLDTLESSIKAILAYNKEQEERLRKLNALEAAGVDNWEGYDEAMRQLHGDDDDGDEE